MITQLPRYIDRKALSSAPLSDEKNVRSAKHQRILVDAFIDNHEEFENYRELTRRYHEQQRRQRKLTFEQRILNSQHLIRQAQHIMHNAFISASHGEELPLGKLKTLVKKILDHGEDHADSLFYLARKKTKQEYTFMRSVSFCVLLLDFARSLGFSERDLLHIGLGALLHDAGKMWVSGQVLNKPGKLNSNEYRQIREHIKFTDLIFYANHIRHPLSRDISLLHHERIDGSGYPEGKRLNDISLIGQLAGIIDVYDATTSTRVYREAIEPTEVLQHLLRLAGTRFETELVQKFIQHIGIYPTGSIVKLSNGLIGIVTEKAQDLLRPVVKAVYDDTTKHSIPASKIKLEKSPGIHILHTLTADKAPFNPSRYLI